METSVLQILHFQRMGDDWIKLVVQHPKKDEAVCVQMHRDKFDHLDDLKKPTQLAITDDEVWDVKEIEGSFFKHLWLGKNK